MGGRAAGAELERDGGDGASAMALVRSAANYSSVTPRHVYPNQSLYPITIFIYYMPTLNVE